MDVELPDAWISWRLLKVEGPRLLGVTQKYVLKHCFSHESERAFQYSVLSLVITGVNYCMYPFLNVGFGQVGPIY